MSTEQYSRMRDLQAIDALDFHCPLDANERAELLALETIERQALVKPREWVDLH